LYYAGDLGDTGPLSHSEKKKKNWLEFLEIPAGGSHEHHLAVYVSEMENPSLICALPTPSSPLALWHMKAQEIYI